MEIYYVNSIGEKLNLVEWPYRAQTSDILDYDWEHTLNTYKRISGFSRGVKEKSITLTIQADSKEEFESAVNGFHNITERDILLNTPGRLYVNDCYMQCYISGATKTEWEGMTNSYDVTIKIITDTPQWIKEQQVSYPASAYIDFESYVLNGSTSEDLVSIGEHNPVTVSVLREGGSVENYSVDTGALRSYDNYFDALCKLDRWKIIKRIEMLSPDLSNTTKLIDSDYVTYKVDIEKESNGMFKSNLLPAGAQRLPDEDFERIDYDEGTECISYLSESANALIEIEGTEEGLTSFVLKGTKNKDAVHNSYEYLQYTYDYLSTYSYQTLISGIEEHSIYFVLEKPLMKGEWIRRGTDGIWIADRLGDVEILSTYLQDELNNFRTYDGETVIYTEVPGGEEPYLQASFMPRAYYVNALADGTHLDFAVEEFVHIEEKTLYIRIKKSNLHKNPKIMYVLEEEYTKEISIQSQNTLLQIESKGDIKRILIVGTEQEGGSDFGQYPHGYPHGYADNVTSDTLTNKDVIVSGPFRMIIYGKCINPEIYIADHLYRINDDLGRDEYVMIDSVNKTITKHTASGELVNIYEKRYKEQSVFEPVPAGQSIVYWDKTFGFDLTLISERSEPLWK